MLIQSCALSLAFFLYSDIKLCSPNWTPRLWGLGWTQGVKNGTNRNFVPTFLFDFWTHCRPIFHRLATIHNAPDRQTDRQTERLDSISGLEKLTSAPWPRKWGQIGTNVVEWPKVMSRFTQSHSIGGLSFTGSPDARQSINRSLGMTYDPWITTFCRSTKQ